MGAHFSRLRLFFSCILRWVVGRRAGPDDSDSTTCLRHPDSDSDSADVEGGPSCQCDATATGATPKRRALLVGISYQHSQCNEDTGKWEVLDGTHNDVKRFRELLISAYSWLHLASVTSPGIDYFS
jgi:hypothetical protein